MRNLILALWLAQTCAKLGVSAVLIRRGMLRRYPVLVGWLVVSALEQAWMRYVLEYRGFTAYRDWWFALQPLDLLMLGMLTSDVLYHVSRQFPESRMLSAVFGMFALISCIVVAFVEGVITPDSKDVRDALLVISRNWSMVCLGTLGMTALYYAPDRHIWLENVKRYRAGVLVFLGGATVAYLLFGLNRNSVSAHVTLQAVPLLAAAIFVGMDAAGEQRRKGAGNNTDLPPDDGASSRRHRLVGTPRQEQRGKSAAGSE